MTLTNPTDDELNAAFAEHVAGWRYIPSTKTESVRTIGKWVDFSGASTSFSDSPNFIGSMDAVLPWLEKCDSWNMQYDQGEIEETAVNVWSPMHGQYNGDCSLPRACVIALLRAHGVEVELTK